MGGEFLYSKNTQVFDGFALGRYIFGSTTGFLHYATAASTGNGFGPNVVQCPNGAYVSTTACAGGAFGSSPLLLYLQDAATQSGVTVQQAGYSDISNKEPAIFVQDTWQVLSRLTLNYGLRWEAQYLPRSRHQAREHPLRPLPLKLRLSHQPAICPTRPRSSNRASALRTTFSAAASRSCVAAPASSTRVRIC